jgi:hypothetical protein
MTLDHFEQSLLTELRGHVAERAVAASTSRRSRRWRWAAVPAGAAAAIVAAVMLVSQPAAAYAVTESGGDVVVTISRLDDAAGLEKALAEHGITADVEYTATPADPPPNGPGQSGQTGESGTSTVTDPSETGPSFNSSGTAPEDGTATPDITSSLNGDGFTLRIDKDSIPTDSVLHITTSGSADSLAGLQVTFGPAN